MYRLQILLIIVFGLTASAERLGEPATNACYMNYPNIEGELLLENEHVVVQRFTIEPGQWEGIHRHPPNQLYIQITDGDWIYQSGGTTEKFSMASGEISWNESGTELSEQHQSRNAGSQPISYLWIAIKPDCLE
jgi:quercetin dioxygenase-like cupin family protein